jgi:ABC-2 type transport system ATP-binding protein
MLEFNQLRKVYNKKTILDIPWLKLESGIYWLHGPNGAGKTTLLRIIAGILPFQGDILLQGHSLRNDPVTYRRQVAWADAEPLYPGFLTGEDLAHFYAGILRPDPEAIRQLSQRLGVQGWLSTRVSTWSSGMTKKIALLLAFLGRPALLALDEPLITLDEAGTTELITLINEYHKRYETAFLLSSHQPIAAERLPGTRQLRLTNQSIQLII